MFNEIVHIYNDKSYSERITSYDNIIDYLQQRSIDHAKHPFITMFDSNGSSQTITYHHFFEKVKLIATFINNTYFDIKGKRIAILPKNDIDSVCIIISILYLGGTAVILNPNDPQKRLLEQIQKSECELIFFSKSINFNPEIDAHEISEFIKRAMNEYFETNINPAINDPLYEPAIIMFTTGTTSSSKGVMQSHYNIVVNCAALIKHHKLCKEKTLLGVLPIYYANGLEFTIISTMMAGSHVVLLPDFNPFLMSKVINEYKVNIVSLVPNMLDLLIDTNINSLYFSDIDYFVTAAAPLLKETSIKVYNKLNKRIIQGYGLTETTNFSTLMPIDLSDSNYKKWMINCEIPYVGEQIFGNDVAIIDENGNILPLETEGEIVMRGHNVMLGYLNNEIATSEAFKYDWFNSGDIGKLSLDKESGKKYLQITGRKKNIVKISGQGVSLDEIDRLIFGIEGIKDVASVGLENNYLGEKLGILISTDSVKNISEENILSVLKENLAVSKLQFTVKTVNEIPRSKNGKINRVNLKGYFK